MNIIKKNHNKLNFFLILGTILLSGSIYYGCYGQNLLLIPSLMILSIIVALHNFELNFNIKIIMYILLILFVVSINPESSHRQVLALLLRLIIALIIISYVNFEEFSKVFIDIILFISFFSLLFMLIIKLDIQSFLPIAHWKGGGNYRNFIVFCIRESFIKNKIYRNFGLWWEPGAFQVFISLAFIFSIINNTITLKKYFIFLLVIISTVSSTGFIVFGLLSIIFWSNFLKLSKQKFLILIIILALLFTGFIFILPLVLIKFNSHSNLYPSFLLRYRDLMISLHMFKDNLLLGSGYGNKNMLQYYGIKLLGVKNYYLPVPPPGSDGVTLFIANCGLLSFVLLIPFLYPKYYLHLSIVYKLIISISLLVMFNTENFTYLLIFNILTFYGIVGNKQNSIIKPLIAMPIKGFA